MVITSADDLVIHRLTWRWMTFPESPTFSSSPVCSFHLSTSMTELSSPRMQRTSWRTRRAPTCASFDGSIVAARHVGVPSEPPALRLSPVSHPLTGSTFWREVGGRSGKNKRGQEVRRGSALRAEGRHQGSTSRPLDATPGQAADAPIGAVVRPNLQKTNESVQFRGEDIRTTDSG